MITAWLDAELAGDDEGSKDVVVWFNDGAIGGASRSSITVFTKIHAGDESHVHKMARSWNSNDTSRITPRQPCRVPGEVRSQSSIRQPFLNHNHIDIEMNSKDLLVRINPIHPNYSNTCLIVQWQTGRDEEVQVNQRALIDKVSYYLLNCRYKDLKVQGSRQVLWGVYRVPRITSEL